MLFHSSRMCVSNVPTRRGVWNRCQLTFKVKKQLDHPTYVLNYTCKVVDHMLKLFVYVTSSLKKTFNWKVFQSTRLAQRFNIVGRAPLLIHTGYSHTAYSLWVTCCHSDMLPVRHAAIPTCRHFYMPPFRHLLVTLFRQSINQWRQLQVNIGG